MATAILLCWMKACAVAYEVEPEFALAVAQVESGVPGGPQLRLGALGKHATYYGPMGIHKCFMTRWDIADPFVNVLVGVRALRGADKRRVLRRYNSKFNEPYFKAVMACYRQNQRQRIFEVR